MDNWAVTACDDWTRGQFSYTVTNQLGGYMHTIVRSRACPRVTDDRDGHIEALDLG